VCNFVGIFHGLSAVNEALQRVTSTQDVLFVFTFVPRHFYFRFEIHTRLILSSFTPLLSSFQSFTFRYRESGPGPIVIMLIKNILFLGLAALAAANPLLEDRATPKAVAGGKTGKKGAVDKCDNTSALTTGVTCPRVKFTAAQIQAAVKHAKAMKLKGKKGKGIHFPAKYTHDKEVKIKVKAGAKAKGAKSKGVKRDLENREEHEDDEEEDDDEDGEYENDEEDHEGEDDEDDEDVDDEEDDEHLHVGPPEDHDQEGQSLVTRALEARARGGGRSRARPKTTKPKKTKPKTTKPKTTKPKTTKPKTTKPKCNKAAPVKVGAAAWMFPILKTGVWKSKFPSLPHYTCRLLYPIC
jgi:hypothetical protein